MSIEAQNGSVWRLLGVLLAPFEPICQWLAQLSVRTWEVLLNGPFGQAIQNLVITGSLITIIPLVIAFLCLQKYWQSGLAAGAVKE